MRAQTSVPDRDLETQPDITQTLDVAWREGRVMEVVFIVTQEADGGFVAEGLAYDLFTEADTWDELRVNAREAVAAYFFDRPHPASIRLHLVRDEVLAIP